MNYLFVVMVMWGVIGGSKESSVAEVMRAAIEQWQNEVCFRATFRLDGGYAKSLDQALRGEIDPQLGSKISSTKFRATGVLCKLGRSLRCTIDFGKPEL